jgi:glycosyltransferase involved in cell wall biosynthesis
MKQPMELAARTPGRAHRLPRVSVLVPAWNAQAYLADALDSALAQSYRSFEVVVVDDGSTDATTAIARRYAYRSNGRIRLLRQANAGLPAARNAAMAAAQGEFFALLDSDDVWQPNHLAHAVAALDADPTVGLVHANIERMDGEGHSLGVPLRFWNLQPDAYAAIALRHEHVSCPTAVFRRACVDDVGGFDPRFTGLGCEDRDLWLRIAERWRLRYLDLVSARYRIHGSNMSANRERMAAARRALVEKMAQSPRGAALARHAAAMVDSDLGHELLASGDCAGALRAQLRALRTRPLTTLAWRRLLRAAVTAAGTQAPARAALAGGMQ